MTRITLDQIAQLRAEPVGRRVFEMLNAVQDQPADQVLAAILCLFALAQAKHRFNVADATTIARNLIGEGLLRPGQDAGRASALYIERHV